MAVLIQYANGVPGIKFSLNKQVVSIGRSIDNDISINDTYVSKYHAVIEVVPNDTPTHGELKFVVHDLKSTNATYVNNKKVEVYSLQHEDVLQIGQNEFHFDETEASQMNFVETDSLSSSMVEFMSLEIPPTLNNEIDMGIGEYITHDEDNLVLENSDSKLANQFSRRLNIF